MLSSSFVEMRTRNAIRILQTVREKPGLSRAEIARTCDLAKSTVSSVVDELVQEAILQEIGSRESSRGRRPVGLTFNAASRVAVGISIDHHRLEIVLTNLDGQVQAVRTKRLARKSNVQTIYSNVLSELQTLLTERRSSKSNISGIGLALPGPLSSNSQSGTLPDYESLRELLTKELDCPIIVDSNTNMAALAESQLGVARDSEASLVVRLGHEVRSALIIDHRILKGVRGRAGEFGHITAPGVNRVCKCGKLGCINAVAATDAIIERCLSANLTVGDIDEVTAAAINGDGVCQEALIDAGQAIGYGIASCVNILAPAHVIVTGRLVAAGRHLFEPLHEAVRKYATVDSVHNCNFTFDDSQNNIEAIGASLAALLEDNFLLNLVRIG